MTDGLSSVRVVVNDSGISVGGFGYNEFGLPDATSPPPADLRGHSYTGGLGVRNDGASLGLYYARQRYFDASLGRWLSADPIGFEGGLNLYAGMGNNPVTNVDPDGLKPPPPQVEAWLEVMDATLTLYGAGFGGNAGGTVGFTCGATAGAAAGPGALVASPELALVGGALGSTTGTAIGAGLGHLTGMAIKTLVRGGYGMMSESHPAVQAWDQANFDSKWHNVSHHFGKHGASVGAKNPLDYAEKALEFLKSLKPGKFKDHELYECGKFVDDGLMALDKGKGVITTLDKQIRSFFKNQGRRKK